MTEYTREQKLKILKKLPEDLQYLMESEDTGAVLLYLGQKYNLNDERVRMLSKIVGTVILGILPLTNLSQEINAKITTDMQIALNLAQNLNVELFFPVMESLKQAPAIANAILTGQPIPTVQISTPISAPMPALPTRPEGAIGTPTPDVTSRGVGAAPKPGTDQYREPAEAISGPLKPKIGPEPMSAPRPVAPPVVTLRPIEKIVEAPTSPLPTRVSVTPAPAPITPQPIKVPLPTPPAVPTQKVGTPPTPMVGVPTLPVAGVGAAPTTPRPLTFTRPVMPSAPPAAPALAAPAQVPSSLPKADNYREPVEFAPLPVPPQLPTEEMAHSTEKSQISNLKSQIPQVQTKQFIASPAETPIDLEEPSSDIVDLRQDKGRF